MRLYNAYYICNTCLPVLNEVSVIAIKSGSSIIRYEIRNWENCKHVLNEIISIAGLKDFAISLNDAVPVLQRDVPIPSISEKEQKNFLERLKTLTSSMETLVKLYESMNIDKSRPGIDVKIPKCNSLKEYMDYLKDIDFILTQCPFLIVENEKIEFNTVDVGSQWITFVIIASGTFVTLTNLAKLVDKAIAIKSHILSLKQQEEQLEVLKLKKEATEEVVDVFKKMKHESISKYVSDMENDIAELADGEERAKVEKSLEKLCMLIDKGVEIYSSIETPNEIKVLFPNSDDNLTLPDNILKLLEDKSEA